MEVAVPPTAEAMPVAPPTTIPMPAGLPAPLAMRLAPPAIERAEARMDANPEKTEVALPTANFFLS